MTESIKTEIEKFEALAEKHAAHGAQDADSEAIFQMVIAHAVTNDPLDVGGEIDFDLYEDDEDTAVIKISTREEAEAELTAQAWKVYEAIQKSATKEDIAELKKYCVYIDAEEFISNIEMEKLRNPN